MRAVAVVALEAVAVSGKGWQLMLRMRTGGPVGARPLLVLLAILALVISACGSQPAAPAAPAGSPAPAKAPAASAPAPVAPAAPPTPDRLVPPFKALIPTAAYMPEVFEAGNLLMEEFKKLGLRPESVTFPTFQAYTDLWPKTADWGVGMAGYSPREDRLDPDELVKFWTCAEAKEKGRNEPNYCSAEFDKHYQAQATLFDPKERLPHVLALQEIFARDLPAVTQMHQNVRHLYNKDRYTNIVFVPGVGPWNTFNFVRATPTTSDKAYKVSFVSGMPALNPMADNFGGVDHDVLRLVYDTLTRVGPDGTPQPWAAEKWKQVNETTVDLTIRQGMKFHDGRPVTVDDVVFTVTNFLRVKPAFYLSYIRPLDGATRIDDRTVRLKLKQPYAPLLLTTLGRLPILPKHIWDGIAEPRKVERVNLTGSGPFKMRTQVPEQTYRLERFADHFNPSKSDEVIITRHANREVQFLALAKGEVYFAEQKGLASEQIKEAGKYPHLQVVLEPGVDVRYVVFNMREKSPFRDHNLRLAAAHLFDYKTYVDVIQNGMAEAGRGVIAPANTFYHNKDIPSKEADGVHYHQYDPAKARKILQDAGYQWDKDGKLYYPPNFQPKQLP